MGRAKKDEAKHPTLHEKRLKEYEIFRINLALLRATTGLSAEKFGKELGMPKYHRVIDLEYGRAAEPKIDEIKIIAQYFKITIDQLLYKKAVISFQPLNPTP